MEGIPSSAVELRHVALPLGGPTCEVDTVVVDVTVGVATGAFRNKSSGQERVSSSQPKMLVEQAEQFRVLQFFKPVLDANGADAIIQAGLFGTVVYG